MDGTSSNARVATGQDTTDRARQLAQEILAEGQHLLSQRGQTHGRVRDNMLATAALWRAFLTFNPDPLVASDIPIMMALAKIGRIVAGDRGHSDHYLDAACYLAMAGGLVEEDEEHRRGQA